MKCYPLGIAALLAIACDCIRRGDIPGAQAALDRAAALTRDDDAAGAARRRAGARKLVSSDVC
jgi:GH24 family phage-related lysozyme (muramidase)